MSKERRILLFILWTYLYVGFCYLFFEFVFHFNIFKPQHWEILYTQFFDNNWVISDRRDIFFVVSVFLVPVFWGVGFSIVFKINALKKIKTFFTDFIDKRRRQQLIKMAKEGKIQIAKPVSSASIRPQKLRTAGSLTDFSFLEKQNKKEQAESVSSPLPQDQDKENNTAASSRLEQEDSSFHNDSSFANPSLAPKKDDFEKPDNQNNFVSEINTSTVFQKARELASSLGFSVFENVKTQKSILPFVISYNEKAWAFEFLIEPTTEWIADEEEFDDEKPVWFTDKAQITSPFYLLSQEASVLQQEAEAPVTPVLVITAGNILNAQTCLSVWKEKGGAVVRFMQGKPADLPTLETYLREEIQKQDASKPEEQEESAFNGEGNKSDDSQEIDDFFDKDDDFFNDTDWAQSEEEKELLEMAKEIK
jgi:hypothetical protein